MKTGFRAIPLLFFSLAACSLARAQNIPAATQPLQISAFGAATGTYTGLDGGKNASITAGADIGWKPFYGIYPAVEVRGTYPVDGGQVDAQKNILFGLNLAKYYGIFHPYGDVLFGRDKIDYQNGGYPNPTGRLLYLDSDSNVFSVGGGLDLTVSDHFAVKFDAQFQHYGVPVTASGHIYSAPLSVGIVYRFDFNHHIHYTADGQGKGYRAPRESASTPVQPPAPAPDNAAPDTAPASSSSSQPQ